MLFPPAFLDNPNTQSELVDDIVLSDIDSDAFIKLLQCVYTEKVDVTPDELDKLVPLANMFQVERLRMICMDCMEEGATIENACSLLEDGKRLFQQYDFSFIHSHASDVIHSHGFLSISKEALNLFLMEGTLSSTEILLWKAVIKWSEAECKRHNMVINPENKRKALGDILYNVRFGEMSLQEICDEVEPSGILDQDELLSIFTYIGADVSKKPKMKFLTGSRSNTTSGFFDGTTILTADQQRALNVLFGKKNQKWSLLFKAKVHGMTGYSFHSRCNARTPTLSVIRATSGNIFGGYTTLSWAGTGYGADSNAFLFSLVSGRGHPFRMNCSNTAHSISRDQNNGPTFGGGHNIFVGPAFDSAVNYCNPYASYTVENNAFTDYSGLLAGAYNFTVDDLEVFTIK